MLILGYILALMMGLTLGLIGAGGSILTVPILVYLMSVKPITATGYSLLIVGATAFTGAIQYWRKDLVKFKAAFTFAIPAMLAVLITRTYLVPSIPNYVLGLEKNSLIMVFFAALMMTSASFILKKPEIIINQNIQSKPNYIKLIFGSAGVGILTGLVGAGGGFLIIPALIALFGLSMKEAVGTSLTIIAINSLVGFKGDLLSGIEIDWQLLIPFMILTILGMAFGILLSKKIDGSKLKKIFGLFTLIIGLVIAIEEIIKLTN
ncbi:MAG TPA: permease [Alphaproteobacteria bacterium]|nr:permease [Alphaproteobacteria bacterium]